MHVSSPVSGVVFELGSELSFAAPFNRIELLRSSWTRCWSWPRARDSCRSDRFMVSLLVSFLNLAPSSRLQLSSIRSSFADVSGLVSGLDSEPGSELLFATPVDQMEVHGSR